MQELEKMALIHAVIHNLHNAEHCRPGEPWCNLAKVDPQSWQVMTDGGPWVSRAGV
jgi:hypothetical protein